MAKQKCPSCAGDKWHPKDLLDHKLCRDSFHPPQAYSTQVGAHLKQSCGVHCGIKDDMEGHCECKLCHNGPLPEGLSPLKSLEGKSVQGVRPD